MSQPPGGYPGQPNQPGQMYNPQMMQRMQQQQQGMGMQQGYPQGMQNMPYPQMMGQPGPQMAGMVTPGQPRSPMVQSLQAQGHSTGQPSPLAGGPHSHLGPGSIGPHSTGPHSIGPHSTGGPLSVHGAPHSTGPASVLGPQSVPGGPHSTGLTSVLGAGPQSVPGGPPSSLLGGPQSVPGGPSSALGPQSVPGAPSSMMGGPQSVPPQSLGSMLGTGGPSSVLMGGPHSTGGPGSILGVPPGGPHSNLAPLSTGGPLSVHGGPASTGVDFLGNPPSVQIQQPMSVSRQMDDPRSVGPHSVNQMNPASAQMPASYAPATPAQYLKQEVVVPDPTVLTVTNPVVVARDLIMKDLRHSIHKFSSTLAEFMREERGEGSNPLSGYKEACRIAQDNLLNVADDCENSLLVLVEAPRLANRLEKMANDCKDKPETEMQASVQQQMKTEELLKRIVRTIDRQRAEVRERQQPVRMEE